MGRLQQGCRLWWRRWWWKFKSRAAIWNLAITDATRALIIAAGGGEAVQGAMAKFPEHPKVQAVGEAAMRALRLSDPSRLSQSLRA